MKDTRLAILLVILLAVAFAISYDTYLEIQKQRVIDSFFDDFEEDLTDEELESIFDDELLNLLEEM